MFPRTITPDYLEEIDPIVVAIAKVLLNTFSLFIIDVHIHVTLLRCASHVSDRMRGPADAQ
jgi:hypothetical protein